MQVVIIGRVFKEKDIEYVKEVFDVLHEHNITTFVYGPYLEQVQNRIKFKHVVHDFTGYSDFKKHKIDLVVTLGGDGTILQAVTIIRDSNIPILGINLGRMGFLANIEKTKIRSAIQRVIKNRYTIDERNLLYLESNLPLFGDTKFAINDFTILKRDTSSMITIHTYINGAFLNSYWADGIIVSTPTGSTGYSLSCGGPIIFPNSGNFVLTPVAPHNLNVRPIVLNDNTVISFEIEGRTDNFLCTLDSRFETITKDHQLAVRKNDFSIKLIKLSENTFMRTLNEKLTWGKDTRN